jgi:hypothetical protein
MRVAFIAAALVMMAPAACPSSAILRLEPAAVEDRSVPPVTPYRVQSLMVLPPVGMAHSAPELAEFERMLMGAELKLVSPGLAAAPQPPAAANLAAPALSDLQRAMAAARLAGVDAVLEVVQLGFTDSYRPFQQVSEHFEEVRQGAQVESNALVRVTEARFVLKARLIDTRDGRLLMGADLSQGTSRVFEPAKDVELKGWRQREAREVSTDTAPRREVAKQQVLHTFIAKLVQAPATAPAPTSPEAPADPAGSPSLPVTPPIVAPTTGVPVTTAPVPKSTPAPTATAPAGRFP